MLRLKSRDDDNITIEVLDKDPHRAADMANYFVDLLNGISIRLGTEEARNNREFIEGRLAQTRTDLHAAEEALREFQVKSGTIVVVDPSSPSVSGIVELYAMKAKREIELAILKRTISPGDTRIEQTELELTELSRKVSTFPTVGMESLRLYRAVAIQQKILEYLVPMYEQAKVDEQKDVPVLLVLDKAIAPERKIRPQRSLIVFLAGTLSFFFFVLLSFLPSWSCTTR